LKKRPQAKFHKQMKVWKVEPAEKTGWVKITCPHCRDPLYVKRGLWLHDEKIRQFIGRSCPYCSKTARIPEVAE
jgi:hypothetical protein